MEKISGKEVLLEERWAVIGLPNNAVHVEMNVDLYEDGEIKKATKELDTEDIRRAFGRADDGYIDEDDRFVFTEKGIEYLNSLVEGDE